MSTPSIRHVAESVVRYRLAGRAEFVMLRCENRNTDDNWTPRRSYDELIQDLLVTFAGERAVQKQSSAACDCRLTDTFAEELTESLQVDLDVIKTQAKQLVDFDWKSILRVYEAIDVHEGLDASEVELIVDGLNDGTWTQQIEDYRRLVSKTLFCSF